MGAGGFPNPGTGERAASGAGDGEAEGANPPRETRALHEARGRGRKGFKVKNVQKAVAY